MECEICRNIDGYTVSSDIIVLKIDSEAIFLQISLLKTSLILFNKISLKQQISTTRVL